MVGVVGKVGEVFGCERVESGCTVRSVAAGGLECRAVDRVEVEGGVGENVGPVLAAEVCNESVAVAMVAIVHRFPCSLGYFIYFLRIACNSPLGFACGPRDVAGECSERPGLFPP